MDLAKTFERRKCNHKEAIPGDDCISSVVGAHLKFISVSSFLIHSSSGDSNKHRYVVATQSQPLRSKLRGIPAVPVVHMNRSVMILEPMSDTTAQAKARVRCSLVRILGATANNDRLHRPSNKSYFLRVPKRPSLRLPYQHRRNRLVRSGRVPRDLIRSASRRRPSHRTRLHQSRQKRQARQERSVSVRKTMKLPRNRRTPMAAQDESESVVEKPGLRRQAWTVPVMLKML